MEMAVNMTVTELLHQLQGVSVDALETSEALQAPYDVADMTYNVTSMLLRQGFTTMDMAFLWTGQDHVDCLVELRAVASALLQISMDVQIRIKARKDRLNQQRFTCHICLERMDPSQAEPVRAFIDNESFMTTQDACRHAFCASCMQSHVQANIRKATIACPDPECGQKLRESDIQRLAGTDQVRQQRHAFLKEIYTAEFAIDMGKKLPLERLCACGYMIQCDKPHEDMKTVVQADCPHCERTMDFDPQITAMVKSCPNCQVAVFKDEGCAEMICPCGCNFSWGNLKITDQHTFAQRIATKLRATQHVMAPEIQLRSSRTEWPEVPTDIPFDREPTQEEVALVQSIWKLFEQDMWCSVDMYIYLHALYVFIQPGHRVIFPSDALGADPAPLVVVDFADAAQLDAVLQFLAPVMDMVVLYGKPDNATPEAWLRAMFAGPQRHLIDRMADARNTRTAGNIIVVVGGWQDMDLCHATILFLQDDWSGVRWKLADLQPIVHRELRYAKESGLWA